MAADSGSAGDGATDAPDAPVGVGDAGPITAPPNVWTWVPFGDALCANGTPTGIGINPSSTGSRVLIYFEGGGACWSDATCDTLMTAANFANGYNESNFQKESTDNTFLAQPGGFFDRTAAANPFKDYSYVFIPYCTGDVFSGNNVTIIESVPVHFVGYTNVTKFLNRLVPTFPMADRVILSGSSAGGYGALFNWYQAQFLFGSVRVDLLDDSGTVLPADILAAGGNPQVAQDKVWNSYSTLPPCSTCIDQPADIYGFYANLFPDHRMSLLSYQTDTTLPKFFNVSNAQFTQGLDEDLMNQFAGHSNLQAFVNGSAMGGHVLFFNPQLAQNGVTVQQFVTSMVTDATSWTTVTP